MRHAVLAVVSNCCPYGFYAIPFLVVIDKEGKLIARNVRGEQVREAILKARN